MGSHKAEIKTQVCLKRQNNHSQLGKARRMTDKYKPGSVDALQTGRATRATFAMLLHTQ